MLHLFRDLFSFNLSRVDQFINQITWKTNRTRNKHNHLKICAYVGMRAYLSHKDVIEIARYAHNFPAKKARGKKINAICRLFLFPIGMV